MEFVATSIVTPAPIVTGPMNNPFLPDGIFKLVSILLSVINIPSAIARFPVTCIAPSDVAAPAMVFVFTPTILVV